MNWKTEWKRGLWILAIFAACFYLPVGTRRFDSAVLEAFHLVKWYAREHVVLCLLPAFFIAGAIGVFVSQASVMKYLGAGANKVVAYGVASVSGTILAVCSCTVLPLFAGIHRMGAGLGPATAFLYSGPAINVLAIILTARVLGLQLGIARAVGAVLFSIVIGLLMHLIFRREEAERARTQAAMPEPEATRPLWQTALYFAAMVGVLVFANWGKPQDVRLTLRDGAVVSGTIQQQGEAALRIEVESAEGRNWTAGESHTVELSQVVERRAPDGLWKSIYAAKWWITALCAAALGAILIAWFGVAWWKPALTAGAVAATAFALPDYPIAAFAVGALGLSIVTTTGGGEVEEWFDTTWGFARQILPLLLFGVLIAGALLGRVGHEGLIPSEWVARAVGGNSLRANFFASFAGAFMYFATLTEVPILQGLIGNGMGQGPALALLLAGPALSLPNMLVIRSVLGTKKTVVFVLLVVVMATVSGVIYGTLAG